MGNYTAEILYLRFITIFITIEKKDVEGFSCYVLILMTMKDTTLY